MFRDSADSAITPCRAAARAALRVDMRCAMLLCCAMMRYKTRHAAAGVADAGAF